MTPEQSSDTPETDARIQSRGSPFACVPIDFARRLERERDAAREALRELVASGDMVAKAVGVDHFNAAIDRARAILEAKP